MKWHGVVESAAGGVRLDRYLSGLAGTPLAVLSRARIQSLIVSGRVLVGGRPAKASLKLRGGEALAVEVPAPEPLTLVPEPRPLAILYEDADLIVIDKPAGLAVHPGAGRSSGTLVHALIAHCRDLSGVGGVLRPGIVHRLDRNTSGVLVVAKHDAAHRELARQFAEREVHKRYVAFVLGVPAPAAGVIDTLYGRHSVQRQRFTTRVKRGKRAVTRYQVVAQGGGIARLDVEIATGRTHQIRVHLSERGHPVLGDTLYGGACASRIRDPAIAELVAHLGRHALHAAELGLVHPITAVALSLRAPLPAELLALADAMKTQ